MADNITTSNLNLGMLVGSQRERVEQAFQACMGSRISDWALETA
jgi:hypothetical protein